MSRSQIICFNYEQLRALNVPIKAVLESEILAISKSGL